MKPAWTISPLACLRGTRGASAPDDMPLQSGTSQTAAALIAAGFGIALADQSVNRDTSEERPTVALNLSQINPEAGAFGTSDLAMNRHGNARSQRSIWRKAFSSLARCNKPRWGLWLLLVFAGNVLVATIAWTIVRLVTE